MLQSEWRASRLVERGYASLPNSTSPPGSDRTLAQWWRLRRRYTWMIPSTLLLEAVVFNGGAGLLIPQPVVLCGRNHHTEAIVRNADRYSDEIPETVRDPVLALQLRIGRALKSIADRQDVELSAALP